MSVVKTESRCRIGIVWYSTEKEADEAAAKLHAHYGKETILSANIGMAQCGRAPSHDAPGMYAVITP